MKTLSPKPPALSRRVRVIRRRSFFLVAPAVIATIGLGIAIERTPSRYRATSSVRVQPPPSNSPIDSESGDRLGWQAALERELRDRSRIAAILAEEANGHAAERIDGVEDVVEQIQERISVQFAPREGAADFVMSVSYESNDPDLARALTARQLSELQSHLAEPEPQQTSREIETLRQHAINLSARLRQTERQPTPPAEKGRAPSPDLSRSDDKVVGTRQLQLAVENLKDEQYKLQQQMADLDRRIASQRQIVDQQKKQSTLFDNPTYAALVTRRAELQGQRDNLINRQELTEKHPRVAAIDDQIAAIDRQIAELRQQQSAVVIQTAEARELASLEFDRNRLRLDLEVVIRALGRQAKVQDSIRVTPATQIPRRAAAPHPQPEYQGLKNEYDEVTSRLEKVEAREGAAAALKVEQPRLGEITRPVQLETYPNRPLLYLIAIVVGLAVGAGCALTAECSRFKTITSAGDVEMYAGLPLLASIPRSNRADQKRRRNKTRVSVAAGLAAALAVAFALAAAPTISELIQSLSRN